MKTLQKLALVTLAVVFLAANLSAQSYKHAIKNSKRVVIENLLGEVTFEGYDGSEIIVDVTNFKAPPKRADGLKAIYGGGEENTGIGLAFLEIDGSIQISGASKQSEDAKYTFKIPNSMTLKVNYASPFVEADQIVFKNFTNEISVKTMDADIEFVDVTGPITSSTIDGNTKVVFGKVSQESPISISSIDGEIDVTIPANTPSNLSFSNIDGEVYTDFDIDFAKKDKNGNKSMSYIGGHNSSKGIINGGGVEISLKTIDGIIYLRKK
ncbi:MAG: hypothetical protein CVU00_09130 [Bacteroidetes bacterium HGW-Bacteroidetes-17]|jgi:hypothetical protein|nr:MAG: hypothetical protein CVU00_09130 [Bacteroidetes bacterium HGW-Bacteroidetes-17]